MTQEEKAKEEALKKVNESYDNPKSKFYRDNERFRWAVGVINERYSKPFEVKKCLR